MKTELIFEKARELGAAIQSSDEFAAFLLARAAADRDEELQDLTGRFSRLREELGRTIAEENADGGKVDAINREIDALYRTLAGNPLMAACADARAALDRVVRYAQKIILAAGEGEDPYRVGETDGCAGECTACTGCP